MLSKTQAQGVEQNSQARMSIEATKSSVAAEERPAVESPEQVDVGAGVFRGLIWTFLLYAALGLGVLFAWVVWQHWHAH
jgi:hypothetical protein